MTISAKRTISALTVGAAMASLPFAFEHLPLQPPISEYIQPGVGFLMFPGLIVGVILAGGNVHTYSLGVVEMANFFFYGCVAYFIAGRAILPRTKRSTWSEGDGPTKP